MNRPTSDAEMRGICPGLNTWIYRDFAALVEKGGTPKLPIALLYETSPSFGHWVGLLETPEGLEHFDSYGIRPDDELKWVPKKYRQAFAADAPHLVRLLARAEAGGVPVNYNEYKLQGKRNDIATCGRWVALRCRNTQLTTTEFAESVQAEAEKMGALSLDAAVVRMVPLPGEARGRGRRPHSR